MSAPDYVPDRARRERTGVDEAAFCSGKSPVQIDAVIGRHREDRRPLLLTRLDTTRYDALASESKTLLDYDPVSRTAVLHGPSGPPPLGDRTQTAVVTAGTSDIPVAREAIRTLSFHGQRALEINDVGVAGLWRLLDRVDELRTYPVIIAVAGMDAALPTVLGGQVDSAIIAVPTATGYGVAAGGTSALHGLLASCAPGISVVNIDNGYGAACAALRILNRFGARPESQSATQSETA